MKAKTFFAVLGIFAFLFVIGCSNDTAVDNPTANNDPTVDISKTGSVKVSDNSVPCTSSKKETNVLTDTSARIWFNAGGQNPTGDDYRIQCNDGTTVGCTDVTFTQCAVGNTNYWFADITVPNPSGTGTRCTLFLFDDSSCTIGSSNNDAIGADSWRDGI